MQEAMQILVLHDGELEDVTGLLAELSQPYSERRSRRVLSDVGRPWDLLIATPAQVIRSGALLGRAEMRSIVVTSDVSRTLDRSLGRLGIDLLVRRPVHPATLRALLLHALYRGPERRRAERVAVGMPVKVKTGWRSRRAVLNDLSVRGATLLVDWSVRTGQRLQLRLPDSRSGLAMDAEVVRVGAGLRSNERKVGVAFGECDRAVLPLLRQCVAAHSRGPAPWPQPLATTEAGGRDRRAEDRRHFGRRVIAMGEAGPQVLLGADLSVGGMRVIGGAGIWPGQRLRIALHARSGEVPLVVTGSVIRDEGAGLAMRFPELSDRERERLVKMIEDLPPVATPDGDDPDPRVLAEIVD
jgi:hypothetical protein